MEFLATWLGSLGLQAVKKQSGSRQGGGSPDRAQVRQSELASEKAVISIEHGLMPVG